MRRWLILAGLVVVTGLAIGGVALATGNDGGITQKITLRFLDVEDEFRFIDVAEPNEGEEDFGPGDYFVAEDILRNRADTRTLGTLGVKCTNLVTSGLLHCEATAVLRGGTIEFAGLLDFTQEEGPILVAVTGGTGRYKNVVGQAELGEQVRPGANLFTVELIPSFRRP